MHGIWPVAGSNHSNYHTTARTWLASSHRLFLSLDLDFEVVCPKIRVQKDDFARERESLLANWGQIPDQPVIFFENRATPYLP